MNSLISVITISFNNKVGIEKTIQSVINQKYKHIEYIIIDGNSTDGTVDVLNKYKSSITYWISEKDKGISDAFNKGIAQAHGNWLIFMNSGDIFYSDDVLDKIVKSEILDSNLSKIFFGKTLKINRKNHCFTFGEPFDKNEFYKRMTISHQSCFFHNDFFKIYGLFDNNFKLAMDYELLLRSRKLDYIFFDINVSIMDSGGISQTNPIKVYKEYLISKLLHTNKGIIRIYFEFLYFSIIYILLVIFKKWKF